jgi:putative multiple sugar transport system substrate-binding protein
MPTKDLQRWNQDGSNMEAELKAAGYEVDLQYASNDVQTQVSQIENMINNGCSVLVIASIEGDSLGTVLATAKEKNIPVIAYDRLIMNTDAVSYYATFDNYMVGTKQGEYIRDQLKLDSEAGPFNLEVTTGDPGDNNARYFYQGAIDVLQPYIDEGKLVVKSGQLDFDQVATASWSSENAQSRAENIVSSNYSDGSNIDAWLCSNDSTAQGVVAALDANYNGEWPIITGQDCDIVSVQNMIAGKQSMSIFKDTRTLASQVVKMVGQILSGETVDVNDTETYDNGTGVIPSYLCEPVFADINNYKELLIDSGYYTEDQLK